MSMDPLLSGHTGTVVADAGALETGTHLSSYDSNEQFQQFKGSVPVTHGHYPLSKADDPAHKKPVVRHVVKAQVFDLMDTESGPEAAGLQAYNRTLQQVYDGINGAEFVSCVIHEPCAGASRWSAYVQWRTKVILPPNQQGSEQYRPQI